ncbi:hypothetical protein LCGC14_0838400 [marine sediment metagenome]|uniref:Uncharacterized protein n=1 Tax=marine sediment metagenome TaxID=412755 RepID=A0A0F9SL72_9ZZZZ
MITKEKLLGMKKQELLKYCKDNNIKVYSNKNKTYITNVILQSYKSDKKPTSTKSQFKFPIWTKKDLQFKSARDFHNTMNLKLRNINNFYDIKKAISEFKHLIQNNYETLIDIGACYTVNPAIAAIFSRKGYKANYFHIDAKDKSHFHVIGIVKDKNGNNHFIDLVNEQFWGLGGPGEMNNAIKGIYTEKEYTPIFKEYEKTKEIDKFLKG